MIDPKDELNSWKAEIINAARTYEQFSNQNLALKNREDDLLLSISELETKKTEVQKTITELEQHLIELQGINRYNDNLDLEIKQDDLSSVGGNRNILDTGELSEVNLVYNDVNYSLVST